MIDIDERKLRILSAIIDDYILTAMPVGSRTITRKYSIGGLSPATIRNEMSDLEELGYLDQPHASAGRVPSAKAYRLYVDALLRNAPKLSAAETLELRARIKSREKQIGDVIRKAAGAVASSTQYTTIVAGPKAHNSRVTCVSLAPISSDAALLILVSDTAVFKDITVRVDPELTPGDLYRISNMLTNYLGGRMLNELTSCVDALLVFLGQHVQLLQTLLDGLGKIELEANTGRELAVSGGTNMLNYPEYSEPAKIQAFLSVLETQDRLRALLADNKPMQFTLRIGSETGMPEMEDCSVLTASYHALGQTGTIGVIGPVRMRYGHVLSVLGAVGSILTETLKES